MKIPTKQDRKTFRVSVQATVGGIKIEEDPDDKTAALLCFEKSLFAAAQWVNEGRTEFKSSALAGEMIGERWGSHPERRKIDAWLEAIGAADDSDIIYFVSAHVLSEWLSIPQRTVKEHRKLYGEIGSTAKHLIELLAATEERYYRGGGHGLMHANVSELFTDDEKSEVLDVVEAWNEQHPYEIDDDGRPIYRPGSTCFPFLEDLLERIAAASKRLHDAGPIHSQPNKKGAMNGYFIRRMDGLLCQRYGRYPEDVLASIASIALDAVIDADLVRKTVGLAERSSKKKT